MKPELSFDRSNGRIAVGSPELLSELRWDVFQSVGARYGQGVLYGLGFTEGLIDALRVTQAFHATDPFAQLAGPALPLLFEPKPGSGNGCFTGRLREPLEARLHLERFGASEDPICFVTAGYAAGWYTELLGETVLVREHTCRARGDAECSFEARPLQAWSGDPVIEELVPYLDINALRERAQASLPDERAAESAEGELFGSFDPQSPAVHVWGPVMILPYSGADDSAAAIETIMGDADAGQVRVVIVDVLGMRLEPLELAGLSQVLMYLRAHEMESILVGMPRRDTQRMGGALDSTLCVDDMQQGIALGFQMVHASTS